ncbi:hypothetical protein [Arthrobacter sp. 754]
MREYHISGSVGNVLSVVDVYGAQMHDVIVIDLWRDAIAKL